MNKIDVIKKIKLGLAELYKRDSTLLERAFDLNERSITFKLGAYLSKQFKPFDVDCEYNRMVDHNGNITEGDYWAKKINLSTGPVSAEDDEATTVFPDIIVHKRKQAENLIVIEVKIAWKNSKRDFDLKKLQAYKIDLKYRYALYLEIDEKKASIKFI